MEENGNREEMEETKENGRNRKKNKENREGKQTGNKNDRKGSDPIGVAPLAKRNWIEFIKH